MAGSSVSKAVKAKHTAGKMRIPKADRKAVLQYRGFMIAEGDVHATNEKAYQRLLEVRKHHEALIAKAQATEKAEKKELEVNRRELAIEALHHGIMHLADTRDLLRLIESGKLDHFTPKALATFARATLTDAATEMEQSLLDLGVIKRQACGYFVPDLPWEPEAQVAP